MGLLRHSRLADITGIIIDLGTGVDFLDRFTFVVCFGIGGVPLTGWSISLNRFAKNQSCRTKLYKVDWSQKVIDMLLQCP